MESNEFDDFKNEWNKLTEAFVSYMEQTIKVQTLSLDSWIELKKLAEIEGTETAAQLFNDAVEREMEFLAELIILKDE